MKFKRSLIIISIFLFMNIYINAAHLKLNFSKVEEIRFSINKFKIAGNLYLPEGTGKKGLIIWVHGGGPNLKTGRFPGTAFFNSFLNNGYAYFRYDTPGTGDSKGSLTNNNLFHDRANIVNAAVEKLKKHPLVDPSRVGLVGSSQAGYVIPLVLKKRTDIAFMIGLSLPAQQGHEQWAYLLKMQLIYEGYSREKAEEFSNMHLKLIRSASRREFLEIIKYFEKNPVKIPALKGYDENFAKSLQSWWPLDWIKTQTFNPMGIIAKTKIPVLSIYGDKDTQVDPHQGAKAYIQCLQSAKNPFYEVKIFPDTDHNMGVAVTGSLKEQRKRTSLINPPGFIEFVSGWIIKLNGYLDNRK